METVDIGILHPGQMGISVAAAAQYNGHRVHWASEGRSPATMERAEKLNLMNDGALANLVNNCQMIISVCPPHAAEQVAEEIIHLGFSGIYLDANAISPMRVISIKEKMDSAGITFIDGGIIGGPAWTPGETWLYLAGDQASKVADIFSDSPLETEILGMEIGRASALKMCYAAYTKGTTALLCSILATAEQFGVRNDLYRQWDREPGDLHQLANRRTQRVTAKAWRFAGEMEEISSTFQQAGLPAEFHEAAAEIYRSLSHFKDIQVLPDLDDVLSALIKFSERNDETTKDNH